MAINPDNITTIRVDQLPEDTLNLTNDFAHSNGTDLKRATIQSLVDLISAAIGSSSGVGYLALSVTDGQQLPDVPTDPSFFLAGAGTYLNINGYPDVICTENLNAIMSLTDHWELAVEIPINPLSGTVESVTGSAVDNTDPLNPVINTTAVGVESIVAGNNISVDNTDPNNPIVSATATGFGNSLWAYKAKTSATSGDPDAGYMLWNNATQISSTQLNFSHLVQDGFDIELLFDYLNVGNEIIIQDKDDSTNNQIWTISGSVTIVPNSYVQVPVTLVSSSGNGTTNFANNHEIFVLNQSVSGGGAVDSVNGQTGAVVVDLQSITDEGNETTNPIKVTDNSENKTALQFNGIRFEDLNEGGDTTLKFINTSAINQEIEVRGLGGTLALTSDITTPTLEEVLTEGGVATDKTIELNSASSDDVIVLDAPSQTMGVLNTLTGAIAAIKSTFVEVTLAGEGIRMLKDKIRRTIGGFYSDLVFTNPTENRTITFKDESGTVAYLSDITSSSAYKFVDTTQATYLGAVIGLAETSVAQTTILANTFDANDFMKMFFKVSKSTTVANVTMRVRINTTNNLAGATQIAILTVGTANTYALMNRNINLAGGNAYAYNVSASLASDILAGNTPGTSFTLNTTADLYVFFTIQLGNVADSVTFQLANISN